MNKELRITLRFVALIATPLCLINSFIFSFNAADFWGEWITRFATTFIITYPQAVLYASIIKWRDARKKLVS